MIELENHRFYWENQVDMDMFNDLASGVISHMAGKSLGFELGKSLIEWDLLT